MNNFSSSVFSGVLIIELRASVTNYSIQNYFSPEQNLREYATLVATHSSTERAIQLLAHPIVLAFKNLILKVRWLQMTKFHTDPSF